MVRVVERVDIVLPSSGATLLVEVGERERSRVADFDKGLRSLYFFHSGDSRVTVKGWFLRFRRDASSSWTCVATPCRALRFDFRRCSSNPELYVISICFQRLSISSSKTYVLANIASSLSARLISSMSSPIWCLVFFISGESVGETVASAA